MSDTKIAEAIASTDGPAETSPALATEAQQTPAEAIATAEGGEAPAPAVAERAEPVEPTKMENKLEMNKENKPKAEKATDVAGRKEKGTPGGFFKKLMIWKKDKKTTTGETPASSS